MKKALFFAGLAAATLTFVGCNKEADYAGHGRKVEIVLSDVATRTINSGMSTEWNAGDELSVFNAAAGTTSWSSNIKFTVQDASANRAAGEVELTADAYDWYAFYPYTSKIPNPTTLNPEGSTYERSGYTTVGGQFQTQKMDDNMEHLAGVKVPVFGNVKNVPAGETPVIEMKNAASVVRFKVVNAQEEAIKVLSVKFTAPEDIVGTYYIDFSGTAPAFVGSGDTYVFDNVMVTNADPSEISPDSNGEFYAVIKPFTAAAGAKLKVEVEAENVDGSKKGTTTKEITLSAATEFKPGYIKLLNIPFDATMTAVTAQEIPYEQAFADGAGDFTIDNVIGSGIWTPATAGGQNCMKGTSHFATNVEGESWLTSPEIDGTTATNGVKLSFKQCINKYFGDVTKEATLWAREKGGEWKQFTISYPALNGTWSAFEEQVVDLSEFKGKTFQFAFKYVGHATAAGTWEVCNVAVTDAVITPEFNAELPGADESLSLTVPATTTSVTINVTGNVAWAASASDGATVAPASGEGAGTVTVSFPANTDPAQKEYTVLVSTDDAAIIAAGGDEFVFTITQEAASTEAKSYPYEEKFDKGQGDFTINNETLGEGLTYVWKHDSSNKYMKASAYAGSSKESESWLISPLVDLTGATEPRLYFSQCINKFFGNVAEEATVWIKEEGGEWAQLTISYPEITSGNWSKMTDCSVDIKSYVGKKVQVAFKYTSSTTAAGTWEIKNFKLAEYEAPALTFGATLATANVAATATEATVNVTGNVAWTASVTSGATVNPASGTGEGSITVTFPANTDSQNTKTYTVTVSTTENVENKSIDLTITQAKADAAGTVTIDWTSYTEWTGVSYGTSGTVGSEEISLVKGDYLVTIKKNNGSTNPNVHGVANDARAYAKATVTVKNTKNVNIETLVFDISEQGLKRLAPITASVGTVATQANGDNTVSWSGEATEVTFTVGDKANYGSDGAEKAGQLCFNDIKVTEGGQGQSSFGATLAEANVAATATEATVNVTGNVAWTASVTSGATVNPASGTGEGAVTVTFPANTDTENSKTYTVTLTTTADVPTKTIQLVITQAKAGGAVTDVLNQKFTGISGSSYTDFSGKTGASGAVYAGQCAGSNSSIQLRSKNSNCGIVTTDTGGKAKKVTVTWESHTMEGRTLNIYGKNTAYSSASDLYDDAKQGTLLGSVTYGTSTEVTISGDYTYIGFRSAADAMYLSEIKIVWE